MRVCTQCGAPLVGKAWQCAACGWSADELDGVPVLAPAIAGVEEGFATESFALLPAIEAGSFWFRSRTELITWALAAHFRGAASLLEVGCGTGFVLAGLRQRFPELRLVGGEAAFEGVQVARERVPDAELLQLDARSLPFAGEFDVVGAFDVLEHLDEDELVLAELARAVRPGGGILVTVPQHPRLWAPPDDFARHRRRYTRRELLGKLERAGIRPVRVTSFVSLLLPAVAASRFLQRRARDYDPTAELRLPPVVDRAFERVMALERRLIARGVSWPLGASLLVAGVRRGPA